MVTFLKIHKNEGTFKAKNLVHINSILRKVLNTKEDYIKQAVPVGDGKIAWLLYNCKGREIAISYYKQEDI